MIRTFIAITLAILTFSDPLPTLAQEGGELRMFGANGPNMPTFESHLEIWRDNPVALAKLGPSPIVPLEVQPSKKFREFKNLVTHFMLKHDARQVRLRVEDGTIIDIHLGDYDQLLFDTISTPTEHVLWQNLIGGDGTIVGDVKVFNTGDPDYSPAPIRVSIGRNDLAAIGSLPTEVLSHETPSWSTVAIYGLTTGSLPHCTGVTIAPSLVLSAAHCFCGPHLETPGNFTVNFRPQFGVESQSGPLQVKIKVEQFVQYRTDDKSFCENTGTHKQRLAYGDLILLKLAQSIPSTLAAAQNESLRLIADFSVADVAKPNQSIWSPESCQFRTLGFGVGRSLINPNVMDTQNRRLRRDLTYNVATETWIAKRPGVTISLFDRTDHAVCPGDSGSGLFVPSNVSCGHDGDRLDRALAGIASKVGVFNKCFIVDSTTGLSAFESGPTTVTRLDSPEVQAWLSKTAEAIGETITFVDVPGPEIIVAADN